MVPLSKVKDLIARHSKLEKDLSSQEIDKKSFAEMSKEYSDLNDIIKEANSYFNFQKNKDELEKLINDVMQENGLSTKKDMGRLMTIIMQRAKGRADGKTISSILSKLLN